jgi:hypothetical protein
MVNDRLPPGAGRRSERLLAELAGRARRCRYRLSHMDLAADDSSFSQMPDVPILRKFASNLP